ncbi:amidohydrolase 2 [Salinisphaera sp. T31B1]
MVALVLAALAVLGLFGWQAVLDRVAGAWTHAPEDAPWVLGDSAQALVDASFADADPRGVLDAHVDVLPNGQRLAPGVDAGHAAAAGDRRATPLAWIAERVRDHAAGIRPGGRADAEYLARLLRQMRSMPVDYRARLFARDAVYDRQGRRDDAASVGYVANAYVAWLAEQADDRLDFVVSIHPDRSDALDALTRWAKAGAAGVVWQPIAQRFDPAGPSAQAFYKRIEELGLSLYLPLGGARADNGSRGWIGVDALRAPLAAGVDVVVRLDEVVDDDGQSLMPALFSLLREPALAAQLHIELSGVVAGAQPEQVLEPLLQHPQFFKHLRYASGYPSPAIASAIDLAGLADAGFLDPGLIEPLRQIYDVNPLLFAFVLMRQMHLPGTTLTLPDAVFFTASS